ncbi:MAG: aspartate aminotransferase family protein, partial [Solirubrobacterales bacterium]
MSRFWHSFADMAAVEAGGETVVDRGEGVYIWDEQGRRYLDATAALWYCNVGYGREEIADAAAAQLRRLSAYSTFGDLANRPAIELCERVSGLAPVPGSRVFLTSGGSDSIDTAAKMARRYWQLLGKPDRTLFVTRERAYHGMHVAGTSLAGIEANASGYGTFVGDVVKVAWDSSEELRAAIAIAGPERVAAFFCEPIIGAGGVFAPPEGYLREAREICRETGVLFVADEVITGFGRTGAWFASSRWGLEPDLVTCAKGITSGYLPMGAVLASPAVAEPFWAPGAGLWRHGYTYAGHATVAAAALANLDIVERERLPERALALES